MVVINKAVFHTKIIIMDDASIIELTQENVWMKTRYYPYYNFNVMNNNATSTIFTDKSIIFLTATT